MPLVSCLLPTFNRFPEHGHLVGEAVESFLRQDHPDRELLICNDAPGQRLICDHPQVRVFNLDERLPFLTDKIEFLIDRARGSLFCRWDDDDISLPWRLSLSLARLGDRLEWRAENYWYAPPSGLEQVVSPGNTHCTAIWSREALDRIGGYPGGRSGGEDQDFNHAISAAGVNNRGETLAPAEIFYLYRWGVSPAHLSGSGGGAAGIQRHYDRIGGRPIARGDFTIAPSWRDDYLAGARAAAGRSLAASPSGQRPGLAP